MSKRQPAHRQHTRTALSRARVLAAAVELADGEGLAAVTMRTLARRLGVEAMSLYHHLPGKEALLDGLVESLVGEINAAVVDLPRTGHWQASVRARCLATRTVMLRHPWAPDLLASRTTIPIGVFQHYEAILATLIDAGFSYHLGHRAMHALGSMPLGFVQELFKPAPGAADAELDQAELARMAEGLPHVAAMVASEIHANDGNTLGWCDSQAEFEFTLDLLLEGLERRRRAESGRGRRGRARSAPRSG